MSILLEVADSASQPHTAKVCDGLQLRNAAKILKVLEDSVALGLLHIIISISCRLIGSHPNRYVSISNAS